jgi:hypothetical protein
VGQLMVSMSEAQEQSEQRQQVYAAARQGVSPQAQQQQQQQLHPTPRATFSPRAQACPEHGQQLYRPVEEGAPQAHMQVDQQHTVTWELRQSRQGHPPQRSTHGNSPVRSPMLSPSHPALRQGASIQAQTPSEQQQHQQLYSTFRQGEAPQARSQFLQQQQLYPPPRGRLSPRAQAQPEQGQQLHRPFQEGASQGAHMPAYQQRTAAWEEQWPQGHSPQRSTPDNSPVRSPMPSLSPPSRSPDWTRQG